MGTSIEGVLTLAPTSYPKGVIFGDTSEPLHNEYEQSASQKYHFGTLLEYSDGRMFRYGQAGGDALSKALMTQGPALTTNIVAETQGTSGTSVEIGDQEIIVDVTSASGITDNSLADGSLIVETSTGIGDLYKILACELLTATTARILLERKIRTAWAAGTVISMMPSEYDGVLVVPDTAASSDNVATGVPLIAVTEAYYCWLQTGGRCPLIIDTSETPAVSNNVGRPTSCQVPGACGVQTAGTFGIWGQVVYTAGEGKAAIIDLCLD